MACGAREGKEGILPPLPVTIALTPAIPEFPPPVLPLVLLEELPVVVVVVVVPDVLAVLL
jgi:hypothetical protein